MAYMDLEGNTAPLSALVRVERSSMQESSMDTRRAWSLGDSMQDFCMAVAGFSLLASAQQTGNLSSTSPFPTNAPIPGNYTSGLRPQVHFSPPQGFMNDLNGMFVGKDGVYHLYYQLKAES